MISPSTTTVAFIGTGIMGCAMAGRLLDAGYDVVVNNRTKSKADSLLEQGASWADTYAEAVGEAQVVITMLGYPVDVEDVYMGSDGIIENASDGAYLIDMTTSSPRLARELHAMGAVCDLHVLDCPVTGGDIGAKEGTLTIFAGGEKEDLAVIEPVLRCMGHTVSYQGVAGMGQSAKLTNQIALAGIMMGFMESLAFAKQSGLDYSLLIEPFEGGTTDSWVLRNLVTRVLDGDYTPGFFVKHFLKDMGIALATADEMELTMPGLETAYQLYDLLSVVGGGQLGTQALALIYEDEATCATCGLDWSKADELDDEDDEEGYEDDVSHSDERYGKHSSRHGEGPSILGMEGFFSPN